MSRHDQSTSTRRLARRHGNALMELVIVLPFLLLVLFGIIEFGSVMYTRHNMVQAAREAVRVLAVQDGTSAQAMTVANSRLSMVSGVTFTINITAPASGSDPNQDVTVEITAPLSEAALADPIGIMGGATLRARAVMRKES
jgi:Flp pilus assembly protein TadG